MNNEQDLRADSNEDETREERLTVEIPTDIQAGRSSADCYSCQTLSPRVLVA